MATYDFRILLETIDGGKTSYVSSSYVDTSTDLVLSASQAWSRITGSVSCSFQNTSFFSQSVEPTQNDINTSFVFKDNNLLSASLTGSLDTGAIEFISLNTEYDRLLRYKFYGEKVCSTLGLPVNQWVYVDQVRLPADDESNYFEGNINAKNIYISDNLSFSNSSKINSDIPFLIDTGSDRHIKFIDTRGIPETKLFVGYDKDADVYEIGGVDTIETSFLTNVNTISGSTKSTNINIGNTTGLTILGDNTQDPEIHLKRSDNLTEGKMEIQADGTVRMSTIKGSGLGDFEIRTNNFAEAIYIDDSEDRVGIGNDEPLATLHVFGDLKVDGDITVGGDTSYGVDTFTDGDTTPSVTGGTVFKTANTGATAITTFDNGSAGQVIYVIHADNNTDFTDGTNLQLFRGLDYTTGQTNDVVTFVCLDGTKWLEQSRNDNT